MSLEACVLVSYPCFLTKCSFLLLKEPNGLSANEDYLNLSGTWVEPAVWTTEPNMVSQNWSHTLWCVSVWFKQLSLDFGDRQTKIHKQLSIYDFIKKLDWVPKVSQNLENTIVTESTFWSKTHSSVVSLGRPLGSVVRPLLLQRTTVSRQEHSAGHLSTGEQLFSSLPDGWMGIRGERTDDMK